ncbi:MAG: putative methyltransferase [Eubacterium sp.]|nr:putative methyltransferase [Eubacterium sp.]
MKILLVYPLFPKTFWSFDYALGFISKKASMPPLGLITIASMLPDSWEKRLVDMNVSKYLKDEEILWADYVFISAMEIQKESAGKVIQRCKILGVKTVAGGPLFSSDDSEFDVDHLLKGEGELTIPAFINDLEDGIYKNVYYSEGWADLSQTPVPAWELVDINKYACLNIQYSRGCPFSCDFCNITALFGHVPRTKTPEQLIRELEIIYNTGWRGAIFFVDDNFIGNRKKIKEEILPRLIQWMENKKFPFTFITEASINLADDEVLMQLMAKAGFNTVFVGIETVSELSLIECNKLQNKNRDLVQCVKRIQSYGIEVQGGFIVGFDSDSPNIFNEMIRFIQESGIVTAMVGLLNAPKGTKLYQRLMGEGRISSDFSGCNTDISINFTPKMNEKTLKEGYKSIVNTIYAPSHYYGRVKSFLKDFKPANLSRQHISFNEIRAFIKANFQLGLLERERKYYWKLFFWSLFKRPKVFPLVIKFSIYGFHFRKIFEQNTAI